MHDLADKDRSTAAAQHGHAAKDGAPLKRYLTAHQLFDLPPPSGPRDGEGGSSTSICWCPVLGPFPRADEISLPQRVVMKYASARRLPCRSGCCAVERPARNCPFFRFLHLLNPL